MSRAVQLRLFMLVAALMFVLVAIEEARKPKYYEWMWQRAKPGDAGRPADGPALPPAASSPTPASPARQQESDVHRRIARDGWEFIARSLTDREAGDLQEALLRMRHGRLSDDDLRSSLLHVEQQIGARWNEYLETAEASLKVAPEDVETWLTRFRHLREAWFDTASPYLIDWLAGRELASRTWPETFAADGALQAVLEQRLLELVQDNTVFTLREAPIWFRLLERLRESDPRTATAVSHRQLLHQPKEYRGQRLRLAGEVREAKRVAAPENALGIESYYVLWLKPEDGNSPMAVYALTLPDGFPEVADRSQGELPTQLRLPVEFSGVFFKLLTYQAQRSVEYAPLLLTDALVLVVETTAPGSGPGSFVFVLFFGAAVGIASVLLLRRWGQRKFPAHDYPAEIELPSAPRPAESAEGARDEHIP